MTVASRRSILAGVTASLLAPAFARAAPGISVDAIRIGQTMPYSGPASAYGVVGRAELAVFAMINVQGGVNGRRIEMLSVDDGYSPPRTVEETRRLVESEQVAFMYQGLGTAPQAAVQRYLNQRGVPQLFVCSGASRWADPQHFPWTIGWQPNYRNEAAVYGRHLLTTGQGARLAVLYQDDDFGRDYLAGLRDVFGERYDQVVVAVQSYQTTDPTVTSQVISLRESGATAMLTVATPKFAAQAIRAVAGLGWRPSPHYLTNASASAASVMVPAGAENAEGVISGVYLKDATDPRWADDPGMTGMRAWARAWAPELDVTSFSTVFGYANALCLAEMMQRCGNDLSREHIMHVAATLRDVDLPVLLPGIAIRCDPADYQPIKQLQLMRWSGSAWSLFGDVL